MKYSYILLPLIALTLINCSNNSEEITVEESKSYTISATIDTLDATMAYLSYYEGGDFVKVDSALVTSGVFTFSGSVESPKMHTVLFNNDVKGKLYLFLENSAITIAAKSLLDEEKVIKGSASNDEYEAFNKKDISYDDGLKVAIKKYNAAEEVEDKEGMEKAEAEYLEADSIRELFITDYITNNATSVVTPFVLYVNTYRYDLEQLDAFYNSFSEAGKATSYGKELNEKIVSLKKSAIGQPAPEFELNDRAENPLTVASFKGKYLLIDFWASWCGPCRAENPNIVKAYAMYHEKGLEVWGISLDKDEEKWLAAIEEDDLPWNHSSELKGWVSAPGKLYAVSSIPHSVLIDKDGIIIAKDLRGDELDAKLAELFNN